MQSLPQSSPHHLGGLNAPPTSPHSTPSIPQVGSSKEHARMWKAVADYQRKENRNAVKRLQSLPREIQRPIVKDVAVNKIRKQQWHRDMNEKMDDFELCQQEMFGYDDEQLHADVQATRHHINAYTPQAIHSHLHPLPAAIHSAVQQGIQHTNALTPEEKIEALKSAGKGANKVDAERIRTLMGDMHGHVHHRIWGSYDRPFRPSDEKLEYDVNTHIIEGIWGARWRKRRAAAPAEMGAEFDEHFHRYVREIDRDPRAGMAAVKQKLDLESDSGNIAHEVHAARAGAVYASEFYPVSKQRHYPHEDWNFATKDIGTPTWLKEGYVRPPSPPASPPRPPRQDDSPHGIPPPEYAQQGESSQPRRTFDKVLKKSHSMR